MSERESSNYSGAAVGITVFAAMMLIMIGIFQAIAGLVALFNNQIYVTRGEWVFQFDVTAWGWVHLLLGVIIVLAGIALFSGATWARTVGVLVALISAILNFAWLPTYPIWAVVIITVDVIVIWALTAHGRDIRST